jgi:hypothetical protein
MLLQLHRKGCFRIDSHDIFRMRPIRFVITTQRTMIKNKRDIRMHKQEGQNTVILDLLPNDMQHLLCCWYRDGSSDIIA